MIRLATTKDAAQILTFWNPLITDTLITFNSNEKTEDELRTMIAERNSGEHAFYVAEEGGEILGFATYSQFRAGIGYARSMEHTIILSSAARGRGLGRELMHAIEEDAARKQYHIMVAGVTSGNLAARDFHAALGYRKVGIMPEAGYKFGQYWDLFLMQKILT